MAGLSLVWVLTSLCLAALLAYGSYMHRRKQAIWWLPMLLRFGVFFTLFLLLYNPVSEWYSQRERLPRVWLVADRSSSLRDEAAAMQRWDSLLRLSAGGRWEIHRWDLASDLVGDSTKDLELSRTRLDALSETLNRYPVQVDAVVLMSDGRWNAGGHPLYQNWPDQTRLYAVPFGQATGAGQVYLERWENNAEVLVNQAFQSEFSFRMEGRVSSKLTLSIYANKRLLATQALPFAARQRVSATLRLGDLGFQNLSIQVRDEKGQVWCRGDKTVRVLEKSKTVLIVYKNLHPDLAALSRALGSSEALAVDVQSISDPIQTKPELILAWGLAPQQVKALPPGVPLWHFPDPAQASAYFNECTGLAATQAGTWQGTGRWSEASERFLSDIENYPALEMPLLKCPSLTSESVFASQWVSGADASLPLGAYTTRNGEESAWFLGRGLWRWRSQCYRREGSFEGFDRWVLHTAKRLMAQNGNKNELTLRLTPENPRAGEPFGLELTRINQAGDPSIDGEFSLRLDQQGPSGWSLVQQAVLSRKGDEFQSVFSGLDTGQYRFHAEWKKGDESLQREWALAIAASPQEPILGADSVLLENWALAHSGGLLLSPDASLLKLPATRFDEQWIRWYWREHWPVLLGLSLALALEWFLRKWLGHI